MRRQIVKLAKEKQANLDAVSVKAGQFRIVLTNKNATLEEEDNLEMNEMKIMNETVTKLTSEAASDLSGW